MNKKILSRFIMAMAVALMSTSTISCSDSDSNDETVNNWDISGNEVVSIKPERTKNLRNPMTGWVLYTGLGDGLVDDFWEQYDNFPSSAGRIKVSDYSNTLYIRGAWSDFNPHEDCYVWQESCDTITAVRFRRMVEGAKARGMKLAFTFVVDSRDKHYNFTPEYVRAAMGDDAGFWTTTGSVQVWSPYPDNPTFQKYYEKFLTDFAAEFNDPDVTMFVSGFGLGKWGETHTLIYSTGDETPRQAVFDWITTLMARLFTKVPIVINYHRCLLSTISDLNKVDADATEVLLNTAVERGFSLRHDAFGMKSYYTTWERNYAASQRYNRPIIMEGGWVESSHGNSIKGDGYNSFAEVRQGEYDEGKQACVNMMDLRYSSNLNSGETYSWFNTAYKLVNKFIEEGGYRLYPDKVSVPTSVHSGSTVSITHRWSNLGWGYCPNNIPQWNYKYKVAFALLDKTTLTPRYVYIDEEPKISDWVLNSPKTYNLSLPLGDVASGSYTWAVGIVDTTKDNAIGLNIAAKENQLTDEGWVKLTDVTVQ